MRPRYLTRRVKLQVFLRSIWTQNSVIRRHSFKYHNPKRRTTATITTDGRRNHNIVLRERESSDNGEMDNWLVNVIIVTSVVRLHQYATAALAGC